MGRRLICSVCALLLAISAVGRTRAEEPSTGSTTILNRFFSLPDPTAFEYRALRHFEAHNTQFDKDAWMDVWTEADQAHGFRYRVAAEGGSGYIRSRVFVPALEAERKLWASGEPTRAGFTTANYVFDDRGAERDGLLAVGIKPRRNNLLLVEGAIFLRPEDGDLVRIEGRLSKSPSFWTRRVEIVRHFQRIAGVRMPVALESTANVRMAGRSTMRMTWEYETVNGHRVGNPVVGDRSLGAR